MDIRQLVPQYIVKQDDSGCECHHSDNCDCMPELIITKNGLTGYGVGHWTYTDETCPKSIDFYGKAYWCEFLGFQGFWAMGEDDAAETLFNLLNMTGLGASVNNRTTKTAVLMENIK